VIENDLLTTAELMKQKTRSVGGKPLRVPRLPGLSISVKGNWRRRVGKEGDTNVGGRNRGAERRFRAVAIPLLGHTNIVILVCKPKERHSQRNCHEGGGNPDGTPAPG